MRSAAVALFLLVPAIGAAAQSSSIATEYIHRAWGTVDGLPQNSITAIVQTRDGYLWLGTFGGLVRFDGDTFTVFDPGNSPGLVSGRITALAETRDGSLWVGTESGLARLQNGRFTSYARGGGPSAELPPETITTLFEDRAGRLWISGAGRLARFDGRTFVTFPTTFGAVGLVQTRDGALWAATDEGVGHVDENGYITIASEWNGPRTLIQCFFVDSRGRLWACAGGLFRLDVPGTSSRFVEVPLPSTASGPLSIGATSEDASGTIWFGTGRNGVRRWREGRLDAYDKADGLTDTNARAVFVDRSGNVWIGTNVGGLNRLKRRHVWSYEVPFGDKSIGPIVDDGADGLWIGGTCAGLMHFRDGVIRVLPQGDGLPTGCVWALLRDSDGTLWIGAPGIGLARRREGRLDIFTQKDGLADTGVVGIGRDRDGVLWVGTYGGVSRMKDDGGFVNYSRVEGLEHDVRCIVQTRDGTLWLGGTNGLSRFKDGRFTRVTAADGLSHPHVRAIYEDADGTIWIGTYGGGLNRYRDGRFTTYSVKEGLPDNAVSRIIEDDRGNLWMSGNKGVFRVARSQLNAFAEGREKYITTVSYGTADGMIIDETNGGQPAGWRTKDGRLWFPTIKGLVSIDSPAGEALRPPVFVERVVVNNATADAASLASLGPGQTDAEFHFTAVDLGAAEKTRFKYRLDGYDPEWIDSGARRVAYYTKIPPGSYRFDVLATNSDGVWSTVPGSVALAVRPLWWQRRIVQAAAGILLLVATGFGVRSVSLRRARARVAELERERALEKERSRIARDLHDDLGSRLTLIAMMADSPAEAASGRIAGAARDAARTMDELVWAVNARNDTVEGFAYYLAQFVEEHVVAAGIRCRMILPPELPARALGADVRRHVYLACKEAVNNAIKHSGAGQISVTLTVEDDRLHVEIADTGRGLPPSIDPTGNGLKNYRERMEAAGGTAVVESRENMGTKVTFEVPI